MEKVKTIEDFKSTDKMKVYLHTGVIYDLDEDYLYIVEISITSKGIHSLGERYKLKHNFKQNEMTEIEAGSYVGFVINSKTEFIDYKNIKIKKAKEWYLHKDIKEVNINIGR